VDGGFGIVVELSVVENEVDVVLQKKKKGEEKRELERIDFLDRNGRSTHLELLNVDIGMTLDLLVDHRERHRLLDDLVVVGNFESRDGIEEGFRSILTVSAKAKRRGKIIQLESEGFQRKLWI